MDEIELRLAMARKLYGAWTAHNIALPDGHFTIGPDADLSDSIRGDYFVQIVTSCLRRSPAKLKVLDLGCLEGAISIQFARAGSIVDGIDIRSASINKAKLVRDILQLPNVRFLTGDVLDLLNNTSLEKTYDVIVCAGILYHLDAPYLKSFFTSLRALCSGILIVDTHVAINPSQKYIQPDGNILHGHVIHELIPGTSTELKDAMWAGWQNATSFWLSEESLSNALYSAGFDLVSRISQPIFPWPWKDRGTWIAYPSSQTDRFYISPLTVEPDTRSAVHPTAVRGYNQSESRQRTNVVPVRSCGRGSQSALPILTDYLNQVQDRGQQLRIWWRDDDASTNTPELSQFLRATSPIPIALAVIPGIMNETLLKLVDDSTHISILQHGWKHVNWSFDESNPSEFPTNRNIDECCSDLKNGFLALAHNYPSRFVPIFVPPWHRCSNWLRTNAHNLGYKAVSITSPIIPFAERGFGKELNVEIDIANWKTAGKFIGQDRLINLIIKSIELRWKWNFHDTPIGILSHHAMLSKDDIDFICKLIKVINSFNNIKWMGSSDLLK